MSRPLRLLYILTVEGIDGAEIHTAHWKYMRTRAYESSLTMDTASDSGRGVSTFDSDCPCLNDITIYFFRTFSFLEVGWRSCRSRGALFCAL